MSKTIRAYFCVFFALLFFTTFVFEHRVLSFYSDTVQMADSVTTGRVEVSIENLLLNDSETTDSENPSGLLKINTSLSFSFDIKNTGGSTVDYYAGLQIVWRDGLSVSGKLFVYPSEYSDETIYKNLNDGNYSGCLAGGDFADSENDIYEGINQVIEDGILTAGDSDGYNLKLFFFADPDILSGPEFFNDKIIEINVDVYADLRGRDTGWAATQKQAFSVLSSTDDSRPVLKENSLAKTYFVSQSADIDLTAYISAADAIDGDITNNIKITSYPAFAPGKAGEYTITYTVKNSAGFSAVPLQITITVWNFAKIESGSYHTLALTSHGKVYSWGNNYYGQLGIGSNSTRTTPVLVGGLDNIIDIAAGYDSSYALTADGQIYSWGSNIYGQLGFGDSSVSAVNKPAKIMQSENIRFTQISAGYYAAGGVSDNGFAYTWGQGETGALGNGASIADRFAPEKIETLSNIMLLEIDRFNGAAVTYDGNVYTWGTSGAQIGIGNTTPGNIIAPTRISYFTDNSIKISAMDIGWYHMAAVSEDGRLFTWGSNSYGCLGNGSESLKNTPQEIFLPSAPILPATQYGHTGVLLSDGTVYLFGQNTYGKLGNGNTDNQPTPLLLEGVSNATYISLAIEASFVLTDAGTVYGMGYGGSGTLGTGSNNNSSVPVKWVFVPPAPY